MQIPENVGSQWSDFADVWCSGVEPDETPEVVDRAFRTLRRLWPGYVANIHGQGTRGLVIIAPAISLGLTLAACEPLTGFDPVMTRVRQGERSARAELEFAAVLARRGLAPELEPQVGSKQLDCSVQIGSEAEFAEVIAPETSEAIGDAYTLVQRVVDELVARSRGTATEVLLVVDPEAQVDTIINSVVAIQPDDAVHYIQGVGWIRRSFLGPQLPVIGPHIHNPDPRPAVATGRVVREEDGIFTSATVRLPTTDERVYRLLSGELHHFSPAERNILVINVGAIAGGIKWLPLIQRWFQPRRNRRIGAVVLYEQPLAGTPVAVRQHWRVAENPYAYVPVPSAIIYAIRTLDQSSSQGEDIGMV